MCGPPTPRVKGPPVTVLSLFDTIAWRTDFPCGAAPPLRCGCCTGPRTAAPASRIVFGQERERQMFDGLVHSSRTRPRDFLGRAQPRPQFHLPEASSAPPWPFHLSPRPRVSFSRARAVWRHHLFFLAVSYRMVDPAAAGASQRRTLPAVWQIPPGGCAHKSKILQTSTSTGKREGRFPLI